MLYDQAIKYINMKVNILKGKLLKDPSVGVSFCISGVLWAKYVSRYDLTG